MCRLPHVISSKGALGDTARYDVFTKVYWPTPWLYGPLQTLIASTRTAFHQDCFGLMLKQHFLLILSMDAAFTC